jgi:hypothetical protein
MSDRPRIPTGMTAGDIRARGGEVPANVPDCAELWARGWAAGAMAGGDPERREVHVTMSPIDPEFRYVTVDVTISAPERT